MELGTMLAREHGGQLCLVHVHEPPRIYADGGYLEELEPDMEELAKIFDPIKANESDLPMETKLLVGDPATEIVHLADKENSDLIIVGSHGRSGMSRLILGSVAESVVRHAHCPVLVCKAKQPDRNA